MAALVSLIQLDAAKSGKPSIIAVSVSGAAVFVQGVVAAVADGLRGLGTTLADAPHLYQENARLDGENRALRADNARLHEKLAATPDLAAIAGAAARDPGIVATTVGFDPENASRTIALDRGAEAGIRRDAGVIDADGVVGRVVAVTPFASTVLLVTDGASKVPAIVQRGRWWGIATGTNSRIRLQYVSQDAKLKIGDTVVTGEGRSFHAGLLIGKITSIDHPEGSLYQTALVEPAVAFGRLAHVIVLAPTGAAAGVEPADEPAQ